MLRADEVDDPTIIAAILEAEARWPDVIFGVALQGRDHLLVASCGDRQRQHLFRAASLRRTDARQRLRHYCGYLAGAVRGPP